MVNEDVKVGGNTSAILFAQRGKTLHPQPIRAEWILAHQLERLPIELVRAHYSAAGGRLQHDCSSHPQQQGC